MSLKAKNFLSYILVRYIKKWNRKLHFYTGLFFLLFIWFFSISGLLLNNPKWRISNFWPDREIITYHHEIIIPSVVGDLAIAKDLMSQLDIKGEIYETGWGDSNNEFTFQVRRPGQFFVIEVDFDFKHLVLTETRVNFWGVFRMLHTFTGVKSQTDEKRNWLLTRIWSFSMDALAVGLIYVVISGIYMWYILRRKRKLGLIALCLGTSCCVFFLLGITYFF